MLDNFKALFNLAEIGQSRTSITNPLQWTMVILVIARLLSAVTGLPPWILEAMTVALIVVLALFIYAYIFCMHTNPDVLRSENYHLSKMAIERGLIGDSLQGLTQAENAKVEPKLIASKTTDEGSEQ